MIHTGRVIRIVTGIATPVATNARCLRFTSSRFLPLAGYASRLEMSVGAGCRQYAQKSGGPSESVTNCSAQHHIASAKLHGACSCGKTSWTASGAATALFVCHCSRCRAASKLPALPAAAFKPGQVRWTDPATLRPETPARSRNTRLYCACCGDYVAEDASVPLGFVALPLHTVKQTDQQPLPDHYRPNYHIFYADRVADIPDALPKWKTLPDGALDSSKLHTAAVDPTAVASITKLTTRPSAMYSPTGQLLKDVLPLSPVRAPEPKLYVFTESDPSPNHVTQIPVEKVQERVERKYYPSPSKPVISGVERKRDVIIIGGGHNALVSAAYLSKKGLDVTVLERRHVVGGAAITEEIIPGFKFSRASYLAGLLRPQIIKDLNLEKYGFKYLPRDPSSFTPSLVDGPLQGRSLILGDDADATWKSIAQFSEKDADAYFKYDEFLGKVREVVSPLLDGAPPDPFRGGMAERIRTGKHMREIFKVGLKNKEVLIPFYELFTAPAAHILDRWFESEILKTTLATDAVIGAMSAPSVPGSAYVLLHHVMGEAAGKKGVWAYVEGGMGAISQAIASSAREAGSELIVNATVKKILYKDNGEGRKAKVTGVQLKDDTELRADIVLSGTTPYHTFLELLPGLSRDAGNNKEQSPLPRDFQHHIRFTNYQCGAFKINCAVDKLPNFACMPSDPSGAVGPQHRGTTHFENLMEEIEHAYREASMGIPATRPVIEMTIPSSVDRTIAPAGKHVVQFFVQYAPYDVDPKIGNWADENFKNAFADRVFRIVDEFAPGFSKSVIGRDVLSPLDLERIFGLHRGNIFHGALSLHQLGYSRPAFGYSDYRTPMDGLYMCAAGAHPGGGVMGAAGRNAAHVVLGDLGKL